MKTFEKIYAGVLGKAIGVRLGAPVEPLQWTYERIQESFGEIKGYVKDSHVFAADDDTNGPVFFVRALIDEGIDAFSPQTVAHSWLNYARENAGMFWWGGEGVSTEHTAYLNLKNGIEAPFSGSAQLNGEVMANQVGGQIFNDSWGLIFPNNPQKALEFSRMASSVSHDEDGLVGAEFVAGMIAMAFSSKTVVSMVSKAMDLIDAESEYYKVIEKVFDFYLLNPNDFRLARQHINNNFGYDHYEGACHIIPNAAICVLGLLYSKGSFSRAVEMTVMCGWDTDSNAGVVGTIMGVFCGLDGIPHHYREPINDTIIASSMSGYLNVVDIPNFSLELYLISLQLKGECDKSNLNLYKPGQVNMNFVLPGSSHGLKITNNFRLLKDIITQNSKIGFNLLIDNMVSNDLAGVYYQTFYNDDYFGDDRYQPAFIPLIYDEQNVSISVKTEVQFIDDIWVCGYIKTNSGILKFTTEWVKTIDQESTILEFMIPDCGGDIISEVGFKIKTTSNGIDGNGVLSRFIVESFNVSGKSNYIIDPQYQKTCLLENVSSFVNNRSKAFVEKSEFNFIFSDEQGLTLTGNYYTSDLLFVSKLNKSSEGTIDIVFWAKGLYTYHSIKLNSDSVSLVKTTTDGDIVLKEKKYSLNKHKFTIKIYVEGKEFKAYIDDDFLLEYHFDEVSYGHFGYGGKNSILKVSEIEISNDIKLKKNAIEII